MSQGSRGFVAVLGGHARLASVPGEVIFHCATGSEADALLDSATPDALIIDAATPWHRAMAERARGRGAAVLAVGPPPPPAVIVDDWVAPEASEAEFKARLQLALARARERRRLSRRSCAHLLTGLPNRRALLGAAAQLAARAQRTAEQLALVLLDLDGFKLVNDTLGHPEGDRLLRRVGAVLRSEVRQDEVCGRIGGDEFALVLTGGAHEAERARDRLVTALRDVGISATAGVAVSSSSRRLRQLYTDADTALLAAKRQRKRAHLSSRRKEVELAC